MVAYCWRVVFSVSCACSLSIFFMAWLNEDVMLRIDRLLVLVRLGLLLLLIGTS